VAHFPQPLLHPDYAEDEDQPEDEHSDVHHEGQGFDQGRDLRKIGSEIHGLLKRMSLQSRARMREELTKETS
jgi:hypothetical protein